jgi:xylulokinase
MNEAEARPARPPAVLAVDLGTTSAKAGLVGLDGTVYGIARTAFDPPDGNAPGRAEQDPETWWSVVTGLLRELAARDVAEVVAIAVDGHGPTLVAVDVDARPTRPAITWLDGRSSAELNELTAATGLRGWALGVLPAALWVERHEPAAAAATRHYLNTWEFIGLRLTGVARTSLVHHQALPDAATLRGVGLPPDRVPPAIGAGERLGGLVADVAARIGLPAGLPVVAGVVDAFASFHGAGLLAPGDAIDVGGAAGGFGVYWTAPVEVQGSFTTPAPLPGLHVVGGAMAATGRALDWLGADVLGGHLSADDLLDEAARVPAGADGLVFLPYLAGERSPLWDPDARGVFAGLTLRHGRAHLTRAVLEASALAIRHVATPILAAGVGVSEMRVCGGPARHPAWNQLKADITGFRVAIPHALETGVMGSAVLGALGIGAYPDLPAAIRAMTRIETRLEPRPEHAATYDALYEAYTALHPAVAPVLGRLRKAVS